MHFGVCILPSCMNYITKTLWRTISQHRFSYTITTILLDIEIKQAVLKVVYNRKRINRTNDVGIAVCDTRDRHTTYTDSRVFFSAFLPLCLRDFVPALHGESLFQSNGATAVLADPSTFRITIITFLYHNPTTSWRLDWYYNVTYNGASVLFEEITKAVMMPGWNDC